MRASAGAADGAVSCADRVVALPVEDVDALMDALDARWPGMRDRLCDSTPADSTPHQRVRRRATGRLDDGRAARRDVYILTAISGG